MPVFWCHDFVKYEHTIDVYNGVGGLNMLNEKGFNEWSGNYDDSILNSKGYPFEGYYQLFGTIEKIVQSKTHPKVLDLGIGTGTLSLQLQKNGADITGVDFSKKMLEVSREKLGDIKLFHQDLTEGLPVELYGQAFDFIVSTYAFHHIPTVLKKMYIKHLVSFLKPDGQLIIGDIGFRTRADYCFCEKENTGHWDTDEADYYFVYEEFKAYLENYFTVDYTQFSSCGGLLIIGR